MMKTSIIKREDLKYISSDITGERTEESFTSTAANKEIIKITQELIEKTLSYIPSNLHPEKLDIALEYEAEVCVNKGRIKEKIPLSLITSRQIPRTSEIRIGMHELENDIQAYKTILAHELGHMLVEWPCRKKGILTEQDEVLLFWSKPIYEGVADFFSFCLTGSRVIGSDKCWFRRSLDDFKTYEEACNPKEGTLEVALNALKNLGFNDKYESYNQWLTLLITYIGHVKEDPYTLGSYVARELAKMCGEEPSDILIQRIIKLALTGEKIESPRAFLEKVSIR